LVREGDVLRVVPNRRTPPPQNHPRNGNSALDQGSDACPATVISALPFRDEGSLRGKHNDYDISCAAYSGQPDVIYQFTPTRTALHAFDCDPADYYIAFSLRTGGACPGATEIACASGSYLHLAQTLTAGNVYYVIVDGDTTDGHGNYSLSVNVATECNPDADLTAPGSISGNTCFAHDDCPLAAGDDQMVRVTISHDGRYTFGLCDSQPWDARLYLSSSCCATDSILATSDYGCPYDPYYYFSRPFIASRFLRAGVYYVDIEGYYEGECGAWTLTVEEQPVCTTRPPNDNCENAGPPQSLPATFTGNTSCASRDCDSLTYGDGETWHAFTVETASDVIINICGSPDYWLSMYSLLAQGCPCEGHPMIRSTESAYGLCEQGPSGGLIFRNLQPGTYYYPVLRDSIYGTEGAYTLHVTAAPTCRIESQPGDVIECFDSPELSRSGVDCDHGCATPSAFQQINLGQTVYGRSFTWRDAQYNYRRGDEDNFEFTLSDTGTVTVTMQAEFPFYVGIYDRSCSYQACYASDYTLLPCSTLTLTTHALRPNTYVLRIEPSYYLAPLDTMHYRATITETPCAWPVVITQQPGDRPEGEPICQDDYHDIYNGGCDGNPPNFEEIACGDTIYGTSGVFRLGTYTYRDIDWYRFTTTEPCILSMSAIAEFNPYLILSNYCPGCDGGLVETWGYAGDLVSGSTQCMDPGTYIFAILPEDWSNLPCGTAYRTWITCRPCAPCTDLNTVGDLLESEPPCSTWNSPADHFNGGCNSVPPAFGPELRCGQSISCQSGTYYSNNGPMRDTDWMPFTLTYPETPRFCVKAHFPVMSAIIGPGPGGHNGCDQVLMYSDIGTGNACDTVCVSANAELPAGTYWLYVSPTAYRGIVCGQEYRAWVTCDPCIPRQVTNLTATRSGDDVILRWSADRDFAGTYTVYHSSTYAQWPSGNWEVLAQNVAPTAATRDRYIHTGAAQTLDSQYYAVVRICP
jgi:hypothetical protein